MLPPPPRVILQFLVDMLHFGTGGGGGSPWTPSPLPPPPSAQAPWPCPVSQVGLDPELGMARPC